MSRIIKIVKKENKMVIAKGWREGEMMSECLMKTEFQLGKMKSSGDGWW